MIVKCSGCAGTRNIIALGGIGKKCPTCKGIGYIEEPSQQDEDKFLAQEVKETHELGNVATIKRRGRKPKNENMLHS